MADARLKVDFQVLPVDPDNIPKLPSEGWAKPLGGARAFHYFEADGRALCRRWLLWDRSQYEPDDDGATLGDAPGREDCKPCWRARRSQVPVQPD